MTPPRARFTLALALAAGGYVTGRAGRPPPLKIVTTVHDVQTVTVERVVEAKVDARTVEAAHTRTVVVERWRTPAGAVHERVATTTTGESSTTTTAAVELEHDQEYKVETTDTRTTSTPVDLKPSWRVALRGEWTAPGLKLAPELVASVSVRVRRGWPVWAYLEARPPVLAQSLEVRGGLELAAEW